jgi:regulatory protein YycI of two-component signal transduction system YycFG
MSWEAAKSWLIGVFLVLDILLGWQYVQSRQEAASYTESYPDLVANTKTLLAAHNFSLQAEIPQDHPNMPSLQTATVKIPYEKLQTSVFPNAKQIILDQHAGQIETDMGQLMFESPDAWKVDYASPPKVTGQNSKDILSYVWNGTQYRTDKALSGGQFSVFDETYRNRPMFDATVIAHQTGSRLAGYEQSVAGAINQVGSPKATISALDALTSLANSVDKSGSQQDNVIENIDLGYALKAQSSPSNDSGASSGYWFPVWRIVTSSQQVYYINAFTGEIDSGP